MKRKFIIFDLDGTLLNTLEDLTDSTNFALKSLGYPERMLNEVRGFVGNGVSKLIERAIPGGKSNPDFETCLEIFKEHYSKNMYNKTAPYPGILQMLSTLREDGCKIAVVSNKFDAAVKRLCDRYFPGLIDIAAGENEAKGIKKKPAADMVLSVIDLLYAKIDDCIYVGDSEVDILTAKNCKIPCINVDWGFKSREFLVEHGADTIISFPEELLKCLW
ncbi:MAG: HAD hydrolase-like protein [Muribaculaceae bacterium]|nr:HAD hydrolase-like protein [Muribaculaceae bacterium]